MNLWEMEHTGDGNYKKTKQVQEKLSGLKLGQTEELAENFFVTKAMKAFAHHGIIPKVCNCLFRIGWMYLQGMYI